MNIAIIGGGASGCVAALRIKQLNPSYSVTIFERNQKILKKVSVTGNGRCNLTNVNISAEKYQNPSIISEMLEKGYKNAALDFFHELGLFTYNDEEGRVYPISNQAKTVVELLSKELFYKGVNIVVGFEVNDIKFIENKFCIDNTIYDYVLICTGSNASVSEDGIKLLDNLPLTSIPFTPSLVGFRVKENIKDLFGVRASATVKLDEHSSKGEVMFKEDGVSGICVMDLSVFKKDGILSFDFLDDYSIDMLKAIVNRKIKNDPYVHLHNLMFGSVNNKLLGMFNKGYPNVKVTTLDESVLESYLNQFKDFKLSISGTYSIMNAHVANGGISLEELNLFESKKYPNLFVLGEATNQVGLCGGFNLWYAFTSGLVAADKICK